MDEENQNINNDNLGEHEPKKITVVSGDGNIEISEVHSHLNVDSPSSVEKKRNTIVIPPSHSDNN